MQQFKRQANVVITSGDNYLIIKDLRIVFNVSKSVGKGYNKSQIEIYNLSKATRDLIDNKNKKFDLNAGYEEPGQLLTKVCHGDITHIVHHSYNGPDIITKIETDDGFALGEKRVSYSGKENTKFLDSLKKVCSDAKLEIDFKGTTIDEVKNKGMSTGYAFGGKLKHVIDDLCESLDADWYIEEDKLRIIARGRGIVGSVPLISEESGMVGVPEKVDNVSTKTGRIPKSGKDKGTAVPGYSVTTLLNPKILPADIIHVRSKKLDIDHDCIVHDINHRGDTHGNEWFSTMKVIIK